MTLKTGKESAKEPGCREGLGGPAFSTVTHGAGCPTGRSRVQSLPCRHTLSKFLKETMTFANSRTLPSLR